MTYALRNINLKAIGSQMLVMEGRCVYLYTGVLATTGVSAGGVAAVSPAGMIQSVLIAVSVLMAGAAFVSVMRKPAKVKP